MKWIKWGLVVVLIIAAVVVFSTKIFQKKYTFYYYPEWNAYYDVQHKNYIYSIDGGKTWDTISNSSNTVSNTLGRHIILRTSSPEIWLENAVHRNEYGGTLNDLVGNFLKTGEDERPTKKKAYKDSSAYAKARADSLIKDSTDEIEKWIKETTSQEHAAKQEKHDKYQTEQKDNSSTGDGETDNDEAEDSTTSSN